MAAAPAGAAAGGARALGGAAMQGTPAWRPGRGGRRPGGESVGGTPLAAPLPGARPPPAATAAAAAAMAAAAPSSFTLDVSNCEGALCRISCAATFPLPPRALWSVLTNPGGNAAVFRDIRAQTGRTVVKEDGRVRVVRVEQEGEVRVLFRGVRFTTRLEVTEDETDEDALVAIFRLLHSPVLSHFDGRWTLSPSACGGTLASLTQDVSPRGVPRAAAHVPLLGGAVKGACARAVRRMLEDLGRAADAVAAIAEGEDGWGGAVARLLATGG